MKDSSASHEGHGISTMKRRCHAIAGALMALLADLHPRAALAQERACPGLTIEADAAFQRSFPDALMRLQGELSEHADVDACARVELGLERNAMITVSVTLSDGRAASRMVKRRDDVLPALQALLLVPEPQRVAATAAPMPSPAPAPGKSAGARASVSDIRSDRADHADRAQRPPAKSPRQLGIELSLITGARIGSDGQFAVGAGALSFLELHGWLVGFEGRADAYRSRLDGDPETALELALLAGRRFDLGNLALDFTAGLAIAMKGLSFSQAAPVNPMMPNMIPPPQSDPSSGPVPRLLLGARVGFSPRSIFRTFVGIDGELGPTRSGTGAAPTSARLPGFSLGLALGASVGTP
jgi:hypothetical protein